MATIEEKPIDPIVEEIRQEAKNKTLTIDKLLAATRQSEELDAQLNEFLKENYFHNLGQEELRKLILSGLDSPWTDFAQHASTKQGLNVLASATSRLGLFGRTGNVPQAEANKEEKQEQDQGPKSTPSSFKRE